MQEHTPIKTEHSKVKVAKEANHSFVQIRQAPLPDPQELKEYKQIDKTLPTKIINMAEKEQRFRHISTYLGQIQFIVIVLGGFGISAYVATVADKWQAISTATAIAVSISYIAYVAKSKKPTPPTQE